MLSMFVSEKVEAVLAFLMYFILGVSFLTEKIQFDAQNERKSLEPQDEMIFFWKNVKKTIMKAAVFFFVFWTAAELMSYFETKTVLLLRRYATWLFVYAIVLAFCSPSKINFTVEDISDCDLKAFDAIGKERKRRYLKDLGCVAKKVWREFWIWLILVIQVFVAQETMISSPMGQSYFPYIALIALYVLAIGLCFYGDYFIGHNVIDRRNFYFKCGKFFIVASGIGLAFFEYDFMPFYVLIGLFLFLYAWYCWEYNSGKVTAILRFPYLLEEQRRKKEEWERMLAELEKDRCDWDEDEDDDDDWDDDDWDDDDWDDDDWDDDEDEPEDEMSDENNPKN